MDDEQTGYLETAHRHLTAAIEAHKQGEHHSVRHRIGRALDAVDAALARVPKSTEPGAPDGGGLEEVGEAQSPRTAQQWATRLFSPGRAR